MSTPVLKSVEFAGKPYRLGKRCGDGGEAAVYEVMGAKDGQNRKIVAKAFAPKDNDKKTSEFYKRFRESALEIIDLRKTYDKGTNGDSPFLLIELFDDCFLPEKYSSSDDRAPYILMPYLTTWKKNLDYLKTTDCLLQILDSIEFLHNHSMTHRDIKAGIILLDSDGKWKLSDYGMLCFEHDDGSKTNTGANMRIYGGPPELKSVAAYESYANKLRVFTKSDIYLFGKLCWQLLLRKGSYFPREFSLISDAAKEFFTALGDEQIPFEPVVELMGKTILFNPEERCDLKTARDLLLKQKRLCEMFYGKTRKTEEYDKEMALFKKAQIKCMANENELIVRKKSLLDVLSEFGVSRIYEWEIINDPIDPMPTRVFSSRITPNTDESFTLRKANYEYLIRPSYVIISQETASLFEIHLESLEVKIFGTTYWHANNLKQGILIRCVGFGSKFPLQQ